MQENNTTERREETPARTQEHLPVNTPPPGVRSAETVFHTPQQELEVASAPSKTRSHRSQIAAPLSEPEKFLRKSSKRSKAKKSPRDVEYDKHAAKFHKTVSEYLTLQKVRFNTDNLEERTAQEIAQKQLTAEKALGIAAAAEALSQYSVFEKTRGRSQTMQGQNPVDPTGDTLRRMVVKSPEPQASSLPPVSVRKEENAPVAEVEDRRLGVTTPIGEPSSVSPVVRNEYGGSQHPASGYGVADPKSLGHEYSGRIPSGLDKPTVAPGYRSSDRTMGEKVEINPSQEASIEPTDVVFQTLLGKLPLHQVRLFAETVAPTLSTVLQPKLIDAIQPEINKDVELTIPSLTHAIVHSLFADLAGNFQRTFADSVVKRILDSQVLSKDVAHTIRQEVERQVKQMMVGNTVAPTPIHLVPQEVNAPMSTVADRKSSREPGRDPLPERIEQDVRPWHRGTEAQPVREEREHRGPTYTTAPHAMPHRPEYAQVARDGQSVTGTQPYREDPVYTPMGREPPVAHESYGNVQPASMYRPTAQTSGIHPWPGGVDEPGLTVIIPNIAQYRELVDYRTYRLMDRSTTFDSSAAKRISKVYRRMQAADRTLKFNGKVPLKILEFLWKFKFACDRNGVHEGIAVWLFQYFLDGRVHTAVKSRLSANIHGYHRRNEADALRTFPAVVNFLLRQYARDDVILEAHLDLTTFRQSSGMLEEDFSELLMKKNRL